MAWHAGQPWPMVYHLLEVACKPLFESIWLGAEYLIGIDCTSAAEGMASKKQILCNKAWPRAGITIRDILKVTGRSAYLPPIGFL